ncbi:MAG: error-prone DNA polymerase [Deltaproteobacteria bacterium]|nr:error-prone DNA polymerase [Deltaproteobacteria bacterium]
MHVELHAVSAFSFLYGASQPEELCERAHELGLTAVALVDRDGFAGLPRFDRAAQRLGIRPIIATSVHVEGEGLRSRVGLYPAGREGYRALCCALTDCRMAQPRDAQQTQGLTLSLAQLQTLSAHGVATLLLAEGPFARAGRARSERALRWAESIRAHSLHQRCFIERRRTLDRATQFVDSRLGDLGETLALTPVATTAPRCASHAQTLVADVFDCARLHCTLREAGRRLEPNRERVLTEPHVLATRFADEPQAIAGAYALAEHSAFSLRDLGYRFPELPLPPGQTASELLEHITRIGARERYFPLTERVTAQLKHELATIARMSLAGYFLVVWDIVRFCRERGIFVQGRGSAANSAVCYALGITAVDPIRMGLLFERFLSDSRSDWPDIDLDLPSGQRREEVIQYVYQRYGNRCAAMTAVVSTYRSRGAVREVGKALGFPEETLRAVSKHLGHFGAANHEGLIASFTDAEISPHDPRVAQWIEVSAMLQDLPRHLGQHPGGMIIAAEPLDQLCPLEPAAMPNRVIVPWDKDDCAALGLLKVDLLGLGMMALFERALPLVAQHDGVDLDLATLPADDPETYAMIQAADTVGVFQIESRAQMSTLPRMKPTCFYDLVVEVALIRPGPIVGKLVHPYLRRRTGEEPVSYPHPSLEPVLKRTLGVPLFQEQLMRVAMVAADFSGAEAEELRRAMGSKRSVQRMRDLEHKLRDGMTRNGYPQPAQDAVILGISSFALYGFPESHAASFALLAYASAYLKRHFTASYTCALLDCWPMGFYAPATVVQDARRHGVRVRPIDVTRSEYNCSREEPNAVRMGLKYARGVRHESAQRLVSARTESPFSSIKDLARRAQLRRDELATLASLGALSSLPHPRAEPWTRRSALWQALAATHDRDAPLLHDKPTEYTQSPLQELSHAERIASDFEHMGLTVGTHPLKLARDALAQRQVITIAQALSSPAHRSVSVAGAVITRQRPPTAKGFFFLTLEDETGLLNTIIAPDVYEAQRALMRSAPLVIVHGVVLRQAGVISVRVVRIEALTLQTPFAPAESHDFR